MALISKIKNTADSVDYNIRDDVHTWGGRNLIWNSSFINGDPTKWNYWGTPPTREIVQINGKYWMHVISNTNQYQGYSQNSSTRAGYGDVQPGDKVMVQYVAYGKNGGETVTLGIHWNNSTGGIISQPWSSHTVTTTPTRYTFGPYEVPANGVGFNVMIGDSTTTAQEFWMTEAKIEKGNKATDWSPAPEDIAHVNGKTLELLS